MNQTSKLTHNDEVLTTSYMAMPATNIKLISYGELDTLHIYLNGRHGLNLSQSELNEVVNISKAILSKEEAKAISQKLLAESKIINVDIEELITYLCRREFGYSKAVLKGKWRKREAVTQRQVWYWLMYGVRCNNGLGYQRKWSLKKLAPKLNRDHSTIIHGNATISNLIDTDPEFKATINAMIEELGGELDPHKTHVNQFRLNLQKVKD